MGNINPGRWFRRTFIASSFAALSFFPSLTIQASPLTNRIFVATHSRAINAGSMADLPWIIGSLSGNGANPLMLTGNFPLAEFTGMPQAMNQGGIPSPSPLPILTFFRERQMLGGLLSYAPNTQIDAGWSGASMRYLRTDVIATVLSIPQFWTGNSLLSVGAMNATAPQFLFQYERVVLRVSRIGSPAAPGGSTLNPVPEVGTLTVLALGLVAFTARLRRSGAPAGCRQDRRAAQP